jgi:hypothetical protein
VWHRGIPVELFMNFRVLEEEICYCDFIRAL